MIGVSASGYFFPHYFQQLLPPLALAAAAGAERLDGIQLWRKLPSWSRRVALVSILALLPAMVSYPFLFTYTPAEAVRKIYPREFFAEMPELGRRIASLTPPEGRVFIFGAEPELLFYARRTSATRYIFLFPLYGPYRNALEKQKAAADEILRAQPSAAVYLPNNLFFASGSEQYFTRWSLSYLKKDFDADTLLTKDASGTAHIVSAPSPPPEQRVLGAILVRKLRRSARRDQMLSPPAAKFLERVHLKPPPRSQLLLCRARALAQAFVRRRFTYQKHCDPNGIRTRVTAVKGRCPRPLDDRVRKAGAISEARHDVASYLRSVAPRERAVDSRFATSVAVRPVAPLCRARTA